jgi:hypothetical protein
VETVYRKVEECLKEPRTSGFQKPVA